MEDISVDLSLIPDDAGEALDDSFVFDDKGWTVFVQDGENRTELVSNNYGAYTGLQLGQTFYYSRVLAEELDAPILRISTGENNYAVWLDDTLIHTDCPDMDNRIGYLSLPMNSWYRSEAITIALPTDYTGKTLTVAQSFPDYTETGSVRAYPASVRLYCGYANEIALIAESFQCAFEALLLC